MAKVKEVLVIALIFPFALVYILCETVVEEIVKLFKCYEHGNNLIENCKDYQKE